MNKIEIKDLNESNIIDYLCSIHNRIKDAHKNNSIEEFKAVADEVRTFDYPDKNILYRPNSKDTRADVYRLNALKSFLVYTKNYPGEEQQNIRKEILEQHYKPLDAKFD
jgi:hypothetical protein